MQDEIKSITWQGRKLCLSPTEGLKAPVKWDGQMLAVYEEHWPGHGDKVTLVFGDGSEGSFVVEKAPQFEAANEGPRHVLLQLLLLS